MLDATTKRKIDSARQILVGKVPDPKQQVDQITTALVYKFMDDMDKESQELGGKAKFFTNGFEKYSWTRLMDKRLSGQQRLDLYVQAITNMSKNPHIPQLFRDIFKGAFLPYNDPETLSLFLKEIDGFAYDHSEDLGDAFEYLLSILGSQGEAGQFRTPRHIIDFIVEVVDPKKNEAILDPACGTAGFLISAYKHILKQNKDKPLTPDEKKKLMNHFVGYDISPENVKLSLVNMYLHGFPDPKIYEYDTLTSEKHWGEQFDVIMANPPFMTPKGGIRPHKRFSVKASRSEVLFVDYILEHLNIKGRAGIIVPEGIVFKNENAYKQLRQMLVEDGLFAVVSLPAGVFNPYSGVKTSILFFDSERAKRTDEILFVKIENDGYDLGAQRRKIDKDDLPEALKILEAWKQGNKKESKLALWVKKEKIAESGDYNLTGERYKETEIRKNQKWPLVELGEICEIYQPKTITSKEIKKTGPYKVFGANGVIGFYDKYNHEEAEVLITCRGATCGTVNMSEPKSWITGNAMVVKPKDERVDKFYLYYFLRNTDLNPAISGTAQPQITRKSLEPFKIPLPPIEVQKEIVEQIEVKQKAIDAAREVIKQLERERERERRYFGQELRKLEDVKIIELGEIAEVISGQSPESKYYNMNGEGLPFYQGKTEFTEMYIGEPNTWTTKATKIAEKGDILMSVRAPVGPVNIATQKICIGRGLAAIRPSKIEPMFLFNFLKSIEDQIKGSGGAVFDSINRGQIEKIKIPLPSPKTQKQLVAEAEKEEEIIAANRRLIEIMERKIEEVLANI